MAQLLLLQLEWTYLSQQFLPKVVLGGGMHPQVGMYLSR